MKRLKYILIAILLIVAMFANSNKVQAEEQLLKIETLKITSPISGEYKTGQLITFVATFNQDVTNLHKNDDYLKITFSESKIERKIENGIVKNNTITYKYTLKSEDKGTLTLVDYNMVVLITDNRVVVAEQSGKFDGDIIIKANITTPTTPSIVKPETPSTDEENKNENDKEDTTLTWTDFSKATYQWTGATGTNHRSLELNIKNVNLAKDGHYYWVYISHNKNDKPDITKIGNTGLNAEWKHLSSTGEIGNTSINSYLETNGDIYIWVAEQQARETKIVLTAKKVERLPQLPLTKRIIGYFNNGNIGAPTWLFCYEPYDVLNDRKVNCKIGKVTDNTILKNIKNNKSNAMSDLLKYAKSATAIAKKTLKIGENSEIVTSLNLVNGAYYYVYFELEDENGKYYPVEDVELYQASIVGKNINLYNHTDRNFVYNIKDEEEPKKDNNKPVANENNSKDNTVSKDRLPQTGMNTVVIISIISVALIAAIIGGIQYKKYNIKY